MHLSNMEIYIHHMRGSRHFRQGGGGGGVQVNLTKKAQTTLFFCVFFTAYFSEVKWLISKKTIIFQGSRGGTTFSRGGLTFSRGGPIAYSL